MALSLTRSGPVGVTHHLVLSCSDFPPGSPRAAVPVQRASYADPPRGERRDLESRGLEIRGLERLGLERNGDSAIFSDSPQPAPQVSGALKH